MNIDRIIFNSMKPSLVLEAYMEKIMAPLTHIPNGESIIKGLPTHDEYVAQAQKAQSSMPLPTNSLRKEAEALVRQIIETPLVKLPKGTNKVAFEQNGVSYYLIGTPVGTKHTNMKVVSEETGEILHTATIAKEDFPKIVVVDDFTDESEIKCRPTWGALHGELVTAFVKLNPFLNVEQLLYDKRVLNYPIRVGVLDKQGKPVLDKDGRKSIEVLRVPVLDDQGNQIIENGVVKMKVKTEKRQVNPFKLLLNRLGKGDRVDGVNHSMGTAETTLSVTPIFESCYYPLVIKRISECSLGKFPHHSDRLHSLKMLTSYGRNPIDKGSPLAFYQPGGNNGLEEKFLQEGPYNFFQVNMSSESVFLHPDSKVVGGINIRGEKHAGSGGWNPNGQLTEIPFVNAVAPYEHKVSYNQHGFNCTGGNPDLDGVDITREKIEANLNACGLNISYEDFIEQLPPVLKGTSFAAPQRLAEDFNEYIADAVKANEGTLPRGLDPDFYKRLETLGIKNPVQGEPQYNPKK